MKVQETEKIVDGIFVLKKFRAYLHAKETNYAVDEVKLWRAILKVFLKH